MASLVTYFRDKHALWYKFLLFLFCVSLIVIFFPGEGSFKYEVERLQGKAWHYEQLTAPFDFPVYKTEAELRQERAETVRSARAYFFRNKALINTTGLSAFAGRLKNRKAAELCHMISDSISKRGIIETSEVTEGKDAALPVFIVEDNEEQEFTLGDFFTLKKADDFILQQLAGFDEQERQALRDSLERHISVNVFFNRELTEKALNQSLEKILPVRGKIIRGQTIINKGEIVTEEKMKILNSLKREMKKAIKEGDDRNYILLGGKALVAGMCLGMMMLFLLFFRKNIFSQNSEITFIFLLMVLVEVVSCKLVISRNLNVYFLPFSIVPILIRTFFDTRTALFAHLNTVIMASFLAPERFEFIYIELFAGIGAIFSVAALSRRSQLFTSIIAVFITYVVAYLSLEMMLESTIGNIRLNDFVPFAVSSACVLFTYPLIYICEKSFGFVSDFTLLELADSNSALLRELAQKAPGTFQHSLQVASLAEEAVYKVGGNALLVRTGAMYHDIGKLRNPRYFIENMVGGVNPHEEMAYEDSARIIITHVIDGIELAKENKLPEQIIDFIRTHHGTTLTRYFYRHYQMEHQNEVIDEDKFRYPGPIPFSKETAVLMMADSVEAASRSLRQYDASSINELVDRVIGSQMEENQFINADITFRDITQIKKIFKKRLMNIYHVRIEYPR